MHPMIRLSVRRHGDEYVDEPIAVAHISRISPPAPGEKADYGCRVALSTQPVTLQVKQGPGEVMDAMVRAQVDLALVLMPELKAEVVSEHSSAPMGASLHDGPIYPPLGVHFQSKWRHGQRQTTYGLIGFGRVQSSDPILEGDIVALYVSLDAIAADGNSLWVRPREEFLDGRFTCLRAGE